MNICDNNLFGNGLLYVTFNQDQGELSAKQTKRIMCQIQFNSIPFERKMDFITHH